MKAPCLVYTYLIIEFCHAIIAAANPSKLTRLQNFQRCLNLNGIGKAQNSGLILRDYSNSSQFAMLNHQWNIRLPKKYPLGYVLPKSTRHVQAIVLCGRKTGIRIIPKSGGHSYEALSFGNQHTIIIDFIQMSHINVKDGGTLIVGPGALLGTVASKIYQKGFGMALGLCFSVGIGGHVLGGGIGFFQGKYGLAMDSITELTMVDAWGRAHTANSIQNPDLFWALRGVGSGYIGIVTRLKFKLFQTTKIRIHFVQLQYNIKDIDVVFGAWQNWLTWGRENEPTIFSVLTVQGSFKGSPVGDMVTFVTNFIENSSYKPRPNFLLEKVQEIFPCAENTTESFPTYIEMFTETGEVSTEYIPPVISPEYLNNLRKYPDSPVYSKAKSFFVDKTFPMESLKKVMNLISSAPRGRVAVGMTGSGGELARIPPGDTAYVHRRSLYEVTAFTTGTKEDHLEGEAWLRAFVQATKFMDNGESSQSYVDLDYKKNNEYLKRYYGSNTNRLLVTKLKWDPQNYFRNPLSIPVL